MNGLFESVIATWEETIMRRVEGKETGWWLVCSAFPGCRRRWLRDNYNVFRPGTRTTPPHQITEIDCAPDRPRPPSSQSLPFVPSVSASPSSDCNPARPTSAPRSACPNRDSSTRSPTPTPPPPPTSPPTKAPQPPPSPASSRRNLRPTLPATTTSSRRTHRVTQTCACGTRPSRRPSS